MRQSAVIHARVEPATKKKAERVLRRLGVTPTDAIRMYYRQICLRGGLPFRVLVPNERTARTLHDSRRGRGVKPAASLDDLFGSWKE